MHSSLQRPRKLSRVGIALLALLIAIAGVAIAAQPARATTTQPPGATAAPATRGMTVKLGADVQHLPGGATITTHTRVATKKDLKAAGYPCCSAYLHLSGISTTPGLVCFKIGITTVCENVFYRSYEACEPYDGGLVYACETGSFVFNTNVVACGTTCTLDGQRGTHSCESTGDRSAGFTVDITGCGDYRINPIPAPLLWKDARQWKRMKICYYTGISCETDIFHVDLMHTGAVNLASGG